MVVDPNLLKRHRAGDRQATRDLIESLLPLVPQFLKRHARNMHRNIYREDVESMLNSDLCTAVGRLAKNDVEPGEVEQYVRNELKHSLKHLMREVSRNIQVEDGSWKRCEAIEHYDNELLDNKPVGEELVFKDEYESWLAVAETKMEHNIAGLLLNGYDALEIADEFRGHTVRHVKSIMARLREKARKRAMGSSALSRNPL